MPEPPKHSPSARPKRPARTHQVAAQATTAVAHIWTCVGAAVEEVRNDYGEDLLVQPCLDERMDAPHIWVQVKATTKSGIFDRRDTISFKPEWKNFGKWIRSLDLIVLVLWDVSMNRGWYEVISSDQLQIALTKNEDMGFASRQPPPLQISSRMRFDVVAARRLTWMSRLEHAAVRYRNFMQMAAEAKTMNNARPSGLANDAYQLDDEDGPRSAALHVCFDAMRELRMVDVSRDGNIKPTVDLVGRILDTTEQFSDGTKSAEDVIKASVIRACLDHIAQVTGGGVGLPQPLMIEFAVLVESMYLHILALSEAEQ